MHGKKINQLDTFQSRHTQSPWRPHYIVHSIANFSLDLMKSYSAYVVVSLETLWGWLLTQNSDSEINHGWLSWQRVLHPAGVLVRVLQSSTGDVQEGVDSEFPVPW